jgi:hypothetical protein
MANPSPPSGWVVDLHLLAAEHARHTTKPPGGGRGPYGDSMMRRVGVVVLRACAAERD